MSTQTLDTGFLLEAAALGFRGTIRALGKLLFHGSGRLPAEIVISVENGKPGDVEVRWSSSAELEPLDPAKFEQVVFDQARVVVRVCERLAQKQLSMVRLRFEPKRGADSVGLDLVEEVTVQW
ncbi:MAG: hypothetical protein ACRDJV_13535 [Actinomycetota bacterium]